MRDFNYCNLGGAGFRSLILRSNEKRSKLNQIDLIVGVRLRNLAGELGAVAKMHEQMVRVEVRMVLGLRFLCWHQQATAAGCNRVCWRSRGNK